MKKLFIFQNIFLLAIICTIISCVQKQDPLKSISFKAKSNLDFCNFFNLETYIDIDTLRYSKGSMITNTTNLSLYYSKEFDIFFKVGLNSNYSEAIWSVFKKHSIPDKYYNMNSCNIRNNDMSYDVYSIGLEPYKTNGDIDTISEKQYDRIFSFYTEVYNQPNIDTITLEDKSEWGYIDLVIKYTWEGSNYNVVMYNSLIKTNCNARSLITYEIKNYNDFISNFLDSIKFVMGPNEILSSTKNTIYPYLNFKKGDFNQSIDPIYYSWSGKVSDNMYLPPVDTIIVNFDIERIDNSLFPPITDIKIEFSFLDRFNQLILRVDDDLWLDELLYANKKNVIDSKYWTTKIPIVSDKGKKVKTIYDDYKRITNRNDGIKVEINFKQLTFTNNETLHSIH